MKMDRFPKFEGIKKVAKIAAVAAIGLAPGQLKGQDNIDDSKNKFSIEQNEQLKSLIFDQVRIGFYNGNLRNSPDNAYFFRLEKDGYDITYNLDNDQNGEKDEAPTIEVDYIDGNSEYILQKGPKGINSRDIVYNYKDNSLSKADQKPYGEFFSENMIVIRELHGKNDHIVNYRKINKEEKEKILKDIRIFFEKADTVGFESNEKNLKLTEEKSNQSKEKRQKELEILSISHELSNYLKTKEDFKDKIYNEMEMRYSVSRGIYLIKFDDQNVYISFVDSDGYKNEVSIDVKNDEIKRAKKYKKIEDNKIDLKEMSDLSEIKKILEDTFLEISK